ncbi:MAG: hypothetical protein M1819_002232 [Sarea resinae]|nr:MAG: hypothetical protein M1819_002232 [Sarea resinae]
MGTSFKEATAVIPIDSHTYSANFPQDWTIGSVPHGGFVTSVFLNVARAHFRTTLSKQDQPHTIILHLEFLRRTQTGPVVFKVHDAKLGRQTSTIHITLTQDGRTEVVGYITNANMKTERGVSLPTDWSLHPAPDAVNVSKLQEDRDANWKEKKRMPYTAFRKATSKLRFYFPRHGQKSKSMADEWVCFKDGERFTDTAVGYLSDTWPQNVERYEGKDLYAHDNSDEIDETRAEDAKGNHWFPTLVLNLDIKKPLPEEGVEWLFARVRSKKIDNGRFDIEVAILDEPGDLVALSHHTCMVLSAERNLAQRTKSASGASSKL